MRNSSYSFIPILLKLYRCCDHALKICMWFGYNPQINFCHFFRNLNLAIFAGILTLKVNRQWVPCVRNSSYSFLPIHLKLYMYYGHGLKICMWFGYNPWIIFCLFFRNLNLAIFVGILTLKVNRQWVPCVRNSSYNLIPILLKLCRHCDHALKICMWLGYTTQINFCHFFTI